MANQFSRQAFTYAQLGDLVRVIEHTTNGVKVENKNWYDPHIPEYKISPVFFHGKCKYLIGNIKIMCSSEKTN